MTISPDDAVGHIDHKGHTYYFCSESCLEQFRADPARFVESSAQTGGRRRGSRGRVHVPHASGDTPEGTRILPDLRHGAGAGCDHARGAAERRARRHDAAVPLVTRADRADSRVHGCGIPAGPTAASSSAGRGAELDRARPRDPRGAVGRLAVLPARMGIRGEPSSEHVHAHCAGRGRRVRIQCGRDDCARALSGLPSA